MTYQDVMSQFELILKRCKQFDWQWLACAADDCDELTARYFRWLAHAEVRPHELKGKYYRWYVCDVLYYPFENIRGIPIHACLPKPLYEGVKMALAEEHKGVHRTFANAFQALYDSYINQRYIGICPVRSLKCPYCGLVQDESPPRGATVIQGYAQCWHCERYIPMNEVA